MSRADKVFKAAFDVVREPRSQAYKDGVMAALRSHLDGTPVDFKYDAGTAQFDAFFAGLDEGHALAQEELKKGEA
jgi:hypothetical protein